MLDGLAWRSIMASVICAAGMVGCLGKWQMQQRNVAIGLLMPWRQARQGRASMR
jgi:hypothetical protein